MITANFFYVQGMLFLHTKSRKLKLRTLTSVENRSKKTIVTELKKIFNIYTSRGFVVERVIANLEFECVRDNILPVQLTTIG